MEQFLQIAIVGVAASLIIEGINRWLGLGSTQAKLMTLAVSVGLASVYVILKDTNIWATIIQVLGVASIVYAFLFKTEK